MLDDPKILEPEFNKLCINPERKSRIRSKSFSHVIPTYLVKRKFHASSRRCYCKVTKIPAKNSFIRPAKLNFYKKSVVRPAKLNLKNSKLFLLKPPTLILPGEKDKRKKDSKFTALTFKTSLILPSTGKVFDDKTNSHNSFKSLISAEDPEILKAFDTLSFKKLRLQPTNTSSELADAATANKRENTSNNSCSVQARMESSVPVDCDDTSIEELASYFDLFVHIPKKMSSMAEMMYI